MKVLVTGSSGFVGSHVLAMAPLLAARFDASLVLPAADLDLCEEGSVDCALQRCDFDTVLHLAAQSSVAASFADPQATFRVNVMGTVHLLRHLERRQFDGKVLYVSTGEVYGLVEGGDLPVAETAALRPASPYAASKLAAETAALAWGRYGRRDVVVARPFNHIGPGQSVAFAVARFAQSLCRIRCGECPPHLTTGRLDVSRDFLDVRDVVIAYFHLLRDGRAGEVYNVCSGSERRLHDVLDELIRLSDVTITRSVDPALLRPVDLPRMVGSPAKLRRDTGWQPSIDFATTLLDLLRHCEGNSSL